MKINNLDMASSVIGGAKNERKVKKAASSSFSNSYSQAEKDNQDEYIKKTLKGISEQGELLKDRMSLKDFMEYKGLIAEFLQYVVKNSHEYSKEAKLSKGGDYRVFGIIKKINEELEDIAQEFLKEERDKFKIIKSITGIQGLLVDMSM